MPVPSEINHQKLEYWIEQLPTCKQFLENFFLTCKPYSLEDNYINYISDLRLCSKTNPNIKDPAEDSDHPSKARIESLKLTYEMYTNALSSIIYVPNIQ